MYQKNYFSSPAKAHVIRQSQNHSSDLFGTIDKSKLFYLNNQYPVMRVSSTSLSHSAPTSPRKYASSSPLRTNFIIALLPLILWGFPVHLLFKRRRIRSTREWLKYLCPCSSPLSSILTVILAVVTIFVDGVVVYTIGRLLYIILFTGIVNEPILEVFNDVLRMAPVAVPLSLMWIKGYHLRNLINSFDRFVINWRPVGGEEPLQTGGSGRGKLVLLYFMIVVIHVLHFLSDYYSNLGIATLGERKIQDRIWTIAFEYSIAILYTLFLPVYYCFVRAIKYELDLLQAYVRSLIGSKTVPKYAHFDEFKTISRKIVDDIVEVNSIFSILLSTVVVVLALYVYGEVEHLGRTAIEEIIAAFSGRDTPQFDPAKVRLVIADLIVIVTYILLFLLIFWEAVQTNDAVRAVHIWLNDFVSEPESVRQSKEFHNGFELLKWYIHSRLEQEKPALLSIMIVAAMPPLHRRLTAYRVIH